LCVGASARHEPTRRAHPARGGSDIVLAGEPAAVAPDRKESLDVSEIAEKVGEVVESGRESRLNNAIGALVALSATFMALCNVKDGNVVQAMAQAQSAAVDSWAYYQAKSTKQALAESVLEQFAVQRDTATGLTPEGRTLIEGRMSVLAAKVKQYDIEKADIKKHAEELQRHYDELNVHDDQFDMAEAVLSISLAVFGITALTRKRWLLVAGLVFAGIGFVFGLAGFLGWTIHPEFLARLLG
jgi:hypothetical protein